MPVYAFTAVARDGRSVQGSEFAEDLRTLERRLKGRRMLLLQCKEVRGQRIPSRVQAELVSQLTRLIGSGIPVERALNAIREDAEDQRTARLAESLRQGLARGLPLSSAMTEAGRFAPIVIPLIRAGEASGDLANICTRLDEHFDQQRRIKGEIIGSLAYPAVLVVASFLALIGLGAYVIPIFRDLFVDRLDVLPLTTRGLFFISGVLVQHGWAMLIALVTVIAATVGAYYSLAGFRGALQRGLLALPGLGRFAGSLDAANVMTVLGILVTNGLHLAPALEISKSAALNGHVRRGLENALAQVRRGDRLAAACDQIPRFPQLARRLIAAGEETGTLGDASTRAGALLQQDIQARLKTVVRLLEPVIILTTGGAVGFVVVSMLQGVYSLSDLQY